MSNLEKLSKAGIIPKENTLTEQDIKVINHLSHHEVECMIQLKHTLGEDFLQRNARDTANCFL